MPRASHVLLAAALLAAGTGCAGGHHGDLTAYCTLLRQGADENNTRQMTHAQAAALMSRAAKVAPGEIAAATSTMAHWYATTDDNSVPRTHDVTAAGAKLAAYAHTRCGLTAN